jgi:H+/gluconate symporter-like permease
VPRRLAVAVALLVFAVCLVSGMAAENTFAETIRRALVGMFVTLVVGLIVGLMAQKMLEENVASAQKKAQDSETKPQAGDR